MDDQEFWLEMRRGFLQLLDVIERKLGSSPRTSELRKRMKDVYQSPSHAANFSITDGVPPVEESVYNISLINKT